MSKSDERETQTDLSEFQTAAEIDESGYEKPNWQPMAHDETDTGSRTRCGNCGETVSQDFARVFGNNDDEIGGCPNCKSFRDMKDGALPGDIDADD